MKKFLLSRLFIVLCFFFAFIPNIASEKNNLYVIDWVSIKQQEKLNKYLAKIADIESGNDWKIVSFNGMIGKYQLSYFAMQSLNLSWITSYKFKLNPNIFPEALQDSGMVKIMYLNYIVNKDLIDKYVGKKIHGITLHHGNMIAGTHLVGCGAFRNFLLSNGAYIPRDGLNNSVVNYMKRFELLDIDIEIFNKFK